jgi:hypothetical protein
MVKKFLSGTHCIIYIFASLIFCSQSSAAASNFFRLNKKEVLTKEPFLKKEFLLLAKRLEIADGQCYFFLEEASLDQDDYYWNLPIIDYLSYSYRQLIAVKIYSEDDSIHFVKNQDCCKTDLREKISHKKNSPQEGGFLLKQAIPPHEKSEDNLLKIVRAQKFISLCHTIPIESGELPQIYVIIHQIHKDNDGTVFQNLYETKEQITQLPLGASFILQTPLKGKAAENISHIPIKLEDNKLKNDTDGCDFTFPPGEYILDILFDGIIFHLFWHQKRTPSPYRIFFFNAVHTNGKLMTFNRMTYFRSLDVSGGCMLDTSLSLTPERAPKGDLIGLWYLGKANDNFHLKFAALIRTIMHVQGIPEQNILFMGSSMGGFMSLKMAEYFPEANVFAYNPQTDFLAYRDYPFGGTARVMAVLRHLMIDINCIPSEWRVCMMVHSEIVNPQRVIAYVQNKADVHHYEEHFSPFLAQLSTETRLLSRDFFKDPQLLRFHNGLNAIEFNDPVSEHTSVGRGFDLSVIDLILQFIRQRQGP